MVKGGSDKPQRGCLSGEQASSALGEKTLPTDGMWGLVPRLSGTPPQIWCCRKWGPQRGLCIPTAGFRKLPQAAASPLPRRGLGTGVCGQEAQQGLPPSSRPETTVADTWQRKGSRDADRHNQHSDPGTVTLKPEGGGYSPWLVLQPLSAPARPAPPQCLLSPWGFPLLPRCSCSSWPGLPPLTCSHSPVP